MAATTLIAGRIYAASQPFHLSGEVEVEMGGEKEVVVGVGKGARGSRKYEPTQREKYLATVWLVVESGFIYSSAAIVQLVTYLLQMNAGVIMEFMLSQLSVSVFFLPIFFFFVFLIGITTSSLFFFFLIGNGSDDHRRPYRTGPGISRCFQQ